jgi:hypothetical protein
MGNEHNVDDLERLLGMRLGSFPYRITRGSDGALLAMLNIVDVDVFRSGEEKKTSQLKFGGYYGFPMNLVMDDYFSRLCQRVENALITAAEVAEYSPHTAADVVSDGRTLTHRLDLTGVDGKQHYFVYLTLRTRRAQATQVGLQFADLPISLSKTIFETLSRVKYP